MAGITHIAQRLTCVLFLMRKYKHYALRFTIEDCYTVKENNSKEKSFCQGELPFWKCKLLFCWQKLRKTYFASAFFWQAQIAILLMQIEKNLFYIDIFLPLYCTNLNCKG